MVTKFSALASVGLLAMVVGLPAQAQTSVPGAGTPASAPDATTTGSESVAAARPSTTTEAQPGTDRVSIGDIVVTARRREESLERVPIAITALSGAALAQRSVVSVDQLRSFAPSVNISAQDRGEATFYIRGQGPGILGGGQRNFTSVATYFAEVPTAIAGSGVFYDLANVQVLKGPQGTLFGRNTTGGAVLFEPAKPTFEIGGYLKGSYGNYDYHEIEGELNLPIVDDVLAIRVAGDYNRRHGFTTSVITGQQLDSRNNDSYRVSVLFKPTTSIENVTIVDSNYRNNTGSGDVLRQVYPQAQISSLSLPGVPVAIPIRVASPSNTFIGCLQAPLPGCFTGPFAAQQTVGAALATQAPDINGNPFVGFGLTGLTPAQMNAALAQQQALGPRRTLEPNLLFRRVRDIGVTNRTTWQIDDNLLVKNIIAFRRERTAEINNLTGPFSYITTSYANGGVPYVRGFEQFTEELQLQGKIPNIGLSYILGYYHEQAVPGFNQTYRGTAFGVTTNTAQYYNDKSDAAFAHVEYSIVSGLQFSGGLRYTRDKRFAQSSVTLDNGTCYQTDPGTGLPICPASGSAKFRALTGDATLQYNLTSTALVYGAYRRGYKSGGLNLPAPTAATRQFNPEHVDDFEVGMKGDFNIGVPLRANVALFYDKYKDIQIIVPVFVNGNTTTAAVNAASAIIKGVEYEGTIQPFRGFQLSGFVSYLDAKCQVDAGTGCRRGRQIPYQPHWKYSVNGQYKLPLPGDTDVTAFATYSFSSRVTTGDPDAARAGLLDTYPGYGTLDARLEWHDAITKGVDLSVFGSNLTNKNYITGGYPLASFLGSEVALYGEPRTYGVSLRVRFGK
ncbi:TonB-dependent receptor [Sphingomonas bacterium]|uniref:TonB-dependent receptor n=1 Tax=Sphingomonas bacterium TaxID=1895847 RepID=UPI0015751892|nr:TonB-dependent receptor [Sphingomonas bacterium]